MKDKDQSQSELKIVRYPYHPIPGHFFLSQLLEWSDQGSHYLLKPICKYIILRIKTVFLNMVLSVKPVVFKRAQRMCLTGKA